MRKGKTFLCILLLGLSPLAAPARDPGGEIEVAAFGGFDRVASMNGRGEVLVAWQDGLSTNARLIAPDGTPRGPELVVHEPTQDYLGSLGASLDSRGFSVVWDQQSRFGGGSWLRRFDAAGDPVTAPIAVGGGPAVDTDSRGRSILISRGTGGIQARRFDAAGIPEGPPFPVAPNQTGSPVRVAADGRGNFMVAWKSPQGALLGRRVAAGGEPRGPVFQIAPAAGAFDLAGNGQGSAVALWASPAGLRARVYRPSGETSRGSILVAPRAADPGTARVSAAMDAAGRFLAVWECCGGQPSVPGKVFGRFFDASGSPLDRAFQVGLRSSGRDFGPDAAAGPAGEFFVAYERTLPGSFGGPLLGRRLLWARRGDDLCRFGAGTTGGFACDLVHDGSPGPAVAFGTRGDASFLADLDGDGRDDPCVFRAGRFLCDTAHDGGAAEAGILFLDGGVPLMGDLDGDGRDDPCSRQGSQVLCDTAHNGGTAEVVVTFGTGLEIAFLGDEDGDGDDDVCVLGEGALLCDTGDDGGAAEARIPFRPARGEYLLLGDVDADGRDDPCLVRRERLLCDTAHDGSFGASYPFPGLGAGVIPLLGDLNGL